MEKYGEFDFSKKYQTENGNEVLGIMDSITIGSNNFGVPSEIQGAIKECVYGIINENGKLYTASWDKDNGECIRKEVKKEEENPDEILKNLKKFNIKIEGIINNSNYDENLLILALFIGIMEKNDNQIIRILKEAQLLDGWETLEPANPGKKGKAIKHNNFGKLIGGKLDENGNIDLENFTFFLKTGGNIARMGGRNLRYTNIK